MQRLLEKLFHTYYKDIYRYLFSLTHDTSLSEDLASEVFLEVVKSIAAFRGESDIKTWLFSIARHKWIDNLRKKNRQVETEVLSELVGDVPETYSGTEQKGPEEQYLDKEMFYNSLIMPVIGALGYMIFRWKAVYQIPLLLLVMQCLINFLGLARGMEYMPFVAILMWVGIYTIFVELGVLVAGLLHFAFRKER